MQNRRQQNIHQAVYAGDIVQVYNSLTRYTSCANDYNFLFQTPLQTVYKNVTVCADHETVQDRNKLIIMKLLINHGAEVNMQGLLNKSPLFLAIQKNQVEGSKLLLRNNADPNVVNDFYDSALHASVKSQFEDITKHLLLYQTDLNIVNIFDYTPLDEAIYNSKFNMGQILIKHGAKSKNIYERLLNACDVVSTYPMLNEQPFIEFLLYHATEIDSHGHFTLKALLYYIVTTQHHEENKDQCFLRSYLDMMGININNGMGDSDLHIAIYDENKRDIITLLKSGSDVNVKNFFGNSPLHLLLETNDSCNKKWYYKIAKLLIKYGADLRSKNCLDETPFSKAVNESHDINLIMMMLAKTAGVYGMLSLDLPEEIDIPYLTTAYDENELKLHELITAIALSQEQLVDRLLEIDRLPLERKNYCCQDVNTALITAIDKGNYSIVKMLLESGFRTNRRFHTTCSSYRRHKNDFKIICLLSEFKDSNIIHHMMKKAFFEVVENSHPNKLTYLLVLYWALKINFNNSNAELITVKMLFKLDVQLSMILFFCNEKLNELKKKKIRKKSIFDLLTMPLDSLVKLLNNVHYFCDCKHYLLLLDNKRKLDYSEYAIKTRLDLAIEKRQLMDVAKKCFNWALQDILISIGMCMLPHHITWKILSFLTIRDLKKLAKM